MKYATLIPLILMIGCYSSPIQPEPLLPERCSGPAGLDCLDKAYIDADNNQLTIMLKNNLGFRITDVTIDEGTGDCVVSPGNTQIEVTYGEEPILNPEIVENQGKMKIVQTCDNEILEGRFKADLVIHYINIETGLKHEGTIQISGRTI